MRPHLKPGLRRVRRAPGELQLGLTPDAGVVVTGLTAAEIDLVEHLDGTRTTAALVRWAGSRGVTEARVHRLLEVLQQYGALVGPPTDRVHLGRLSEERRRSLRADADAWSVTYPDGGDGYRVLAERTHRPVHVQGRGRLGNAVADALRSSGLTVERIETGRDPLVPAAAHRADAGDDPPAVVVLTGADRVPTTATAPLVRAGVAHLAVVAAVDRVVIGPLVDPGRTACLHCVDLARSQRDAAWPAVSAQLSAEQEPVRGAAGLIAIAAGLAAVSVATWLDGRRTPPCLGATLTVSLSDLIPVRRRWSPHPSCGCCWLAGAGAASAG